MKTEMICNSAAKWQVMHGIAAEINLLTELQICEGDQLWGTDRIPQRYFEESMNPLI